MRRLLLRLAWRNLSIQMKVIAATVPAVILLGISSFLGSSLRLSLQRQETAVINTAAEIRSLAQEMQFNVETLDRIQTQLVDNVDLLDPTQFERAVRTFPADFKAASADLTNSARQIQSLSQRLQEAAAESAIADENEIMLGTIQIAQQNFDETLDLVSELGTRDTGALSQLVVLGDQMEALTLLQGDNRLVSQMLLIRSLERSLVATRDPDTLTALQNAAGDYISIYQTEIPAEGRLPEIPRTLDSYVAQAQVVADLLSTLDSSFTSSAFTLDLMRDAASRLSRITASETEAALVRLDRQRAFAANVLTISYLVALAISTAIFFLFGRGIIMRTRSLVYAAQQLEKGNLETRVEMPGDDEFSQIAYSFNAVAAQLSALLGSLEQRVAERTRDLSITGEIGQLVVNLRNPRELMNEIVNLVRDRFGFYHAQVFLVDDAGSKANLVASTGAAGRELLARGHYLEVGSQSVIGQVTARNTPVVALDTDTDITHRRNELLPDTRSEMALPMRIGGRVIGALDVQSVAPNAFDEDDIAVFQIIADELAIALDNARLYNELADTRVQMAAVERHATAAAWQQFAAQSSVAGALSYEIAPQGVVPAEAGPSAPMRQALRSGRLIATGDGEDGITLAVPIKVRGEVIGAFGFGGESLHSMAEEDLALVQAVADRVGLALENLRLMQEAAERAEYEQVVNEITAKITGSTDVNFILQTTVRELGRVLRAPQTSVQLKQIKAGEDHDH